jgi:hypothetical protein
MGKQNKKGAGLMKGTEINDGESWARCPICNVIWDASFVSCGFCYIPWQVKDCGLPPAELPQKLCPDHVEEIVVDGRRKGIKRSLYQDQLNEIKKNGLRCPVCKSEDLQWGDELDNDRTGLDEALWKCNQCHALILLGGRFKDDGKDEDGELVHVFYREDLETKELNEAWPDIMRIIDSPGVKIESIA